MLSIIIPTLNEEDYLPLTLASVKKQNFHNYEIIIADADSKDRTLEIAKSYGCVTVSGGIPAVGRNSGAKIAKGELLFFLDADTMLPDHFLEESLQEFDARKLDIASFCLAPYPKNSFEQFVINVFYNTMIIMLERVLPHSAMGILIKKELFNKMNGYDESITLAEDHDLGRRAAKYGKFGIIKSVSLFISTRRFRKDSWVITGAKFFLCQLHMIFIGPVRSNLFNYKFDHYIKRKK